MATTTLAATLNTPLSDLRPATMDRILVIADDSALRNALHRLFSLERYEVEVVTDSVTGLARLRERPFSAVILDLQRPGSSGWDLCRNIADSISGLPLVVLSASPDVARPGPSPGNGRRRLLNHTVQPQGTCCATARAN